MKLKRRTKIVLGIVGAVLLCGFLWLEPWAWMFGQPKIRISRETTYLTEPVRADGTIDYLAAENVKFGEGVTPDNNAVVLLVRALGPSEIPAPIRPRFFKLLGIAPPPDEGDYLRSSKSYFKSLAAKSPDESSPAITVDDLDQMLEVAMARPWSETEFPHIADWLNSNAAPLKLIDEASKRPRYFEPMLTDDEDGLVLAAFLPVAGESKNLPALLRARAMLRIQRGEEDLAIGDLLACNRLGKLLHDQGGTLVHILIGNVCVSHACEGVSAAAYYGKLSRERIEFLRTTLVAMESHRRLAEMVDQEERFMALDGLSHTAGDLASLTQLSGPKPEKTVWRSIGRFFNDAACDWNESLIEINQAYDELAVAMREPDKTSRRDLLRALTKKLEAKTKEVKAANKALIGRKGRGRAIGNMMNALTIPAMIMVEKSCDATQAQFSLTQLSLDLAAYRIDQSSYPEKLSDLAPKYIAELPKDPFGGGDFHYERRENGFRLYSIGQNEIDDGGKGANDDGWEDDIVIEFPRQPPEKAEKPENALDADSPM